LTIWDLKVGTYIHRKPAVLAVPSGRIGLPVSASLHPRFSSSWRLSHMTQLKHIYTNFENTAVDFRRLMRQGLGSFDGCFSSPMRFRVLNITSGIWSLVAWLADCEDALFMESPAISKFALARSLLHWDR
jgi:hypothetical protein